MVTALVVKSGEHPSITHLCDDRKFLDCAVRVETDVPYSATTLKIDEGIAVIYGGEGCALGLDGNRRIGKQIIAGIFYIVGVQNQKLRSLTDEEIVRYAMRFWEPEIFSDDEMVESWLSVLLNDV